MIDKLIVSMLHNLKNANKAPLFLFLQCFIATSLALSLLSCHSTEVNWKKQFSCGNKVCKPFNIHFRDIKKKNVWIVVAIAQTYKQYHGSIIKFFENLVLMTEIIITKKHASSLKTILEVKIWNSIKLSTEDKPRT